MLSTQGPLSQTTLNAHPVNESLPNPLPDTFAPGPPLQTAAPMPVHSVAPPPQDFNPAITSTASVGPVLSPIHPGVTAPNLLSSGPPTNVLSHVQPTTAPPTLPPVSAPPTTFLPPGGNAQDNSSGIVSSQVQLIYSLFAPILPQMIDQQVRAGFAQLSQDLIAQIGQSIVTQAQVQPSGTDQDTSMESEQSTTNGDTNDGDDEDEGINYHPITRGRRNEDAGNSRDLVLTVSSTIQY
jgi:hypothetical protein